MGFLDDTGLTQAVSEIKAYCVAAFAAIAHTHDAATPSTSGTGGTAGFMSAADKEKLNGIAAGANAYTLPTASTSTLGGVKVDGTTVTIDSSGVISSSGGGGGGDVTGVKGDAESTYRTGNVNITAANVGAAESAHTHSNASPSTSGSGGAAGFMSAADKEKLDGIDAGANAYTLPTMSASTKGGAKLGTGLTVDSSEKLNLSAATTSTLGGVIPDGTTITVDNDGTIHGQAGGGDVTGVKGNKESTYRTGNVNLTPANIGAAASSHEHVFTDVDTVGSGNNAKQVLPYLVFGSLAWTSANLASCKAAVADYRPCVARFSNGAVVEFDSDPQTDAYN